MSQRTGLRTIQKLSTLPGEALVKKDPSVDLESAMFNKPAKFTASTWTRSRQPGAPEGTPSLIGTSGIAWQLDHTKSQQKAHILAEWLIEAPWYDPNCQAWVLSLEAIGPDPIDTPLLPGATHYLAMWGLLPTTNLPDIDKWYIHEFEQEHFSGCWMRLQFAVDFHESAVSIARHLVGRIVTGLLPPGLTFTTTWESATAEYMTAVLGGGLH